MNEDIRDSTVKKQYAAVNLTECNNKPDACDDVGTGFHIDVTTSRRRINENDSRLELYRK